MLNKRFTRVSFLQQVSQFWLTALLSRFRNDLTRQGLKVPTAYHSDEEFFGTLVSQAMGPVGLPETLVETLHAIEQMASPEGHERLLRAIDEAQRSLILYPDATPADVAVQFWLSEPALFIEKYNEHQFVRLASFDYFSGRHPSDLWPFFETPDDATLGAITADLDAWFLAHNRGQQHTCVQAFEMDDEVWFLIRHGDTFARVPTAAEGQHVVILHFRPTKDDVVVYNPERHELRVHAGTKAERDLYVQTLGLRVFGDSDEFSGGPAYTLVPLLTEGLDALDVHDIPEIQRIVLREVEWSADDDNNEVTIRKADDLYATAQSRKFRQAGLKTSLRLSRALFDCYFRDSAKPQKVQVRTPSTVQVGRYCYARPVHQWLAKRGFRVPVLRTAGAQEVSHAQLVARS